MALDDSLVGNSMSDRTICDFLGRKLVIASTVDVFAEEDLRDAVVILLEGSPTELCLRRALSPDMIDVALFDATQATTQTEVLEMARIVRSRGVGVVLAVQRDEFGRLACREFMCVGHAAILDGTKLEEMRFAVDTAARQTKALAAFRGKS